MTEEQARSKWCPMVRCDGPDNGGPGGPRDNSRNPELARCIGPECALWREYGKPQGTGASMGECGLIL
jgi:hypothetical protein